MGEKLSLLKSPIIPDVTIQPVFKSVYQAHLHMTSAGNLFQS